jgi:hypothetical protein
MGKHRRKAVRSTLYQIRWWDGRTNHLVQVRGEKRLNGLRMTLDALPWVDAKSIQVQQVG